MISFKTFIAEGEVVPFHRHVVNYGDKPYGTVHYGGKKRIRDILNRSVDVHVHVMTRLKDGKTATIRSRHRKDGFESAKQWLNTQAHIEDGKLSPGAHLRNLIKETYYSYGYLVLDKKGKPYKDKNGNTVFTQDKLAAQKVADKIGGTLKRLRY